MAELLNIPDSGKKLEKLVELLYRTDYGTPSYIRLEEEANRLSQLGYTF